MEQILCDSLVLDEQNYKDVCKELTNAEVKDKKTILEEEKFIAEGKEHIIENFFPLNLKENDLVSDKFKKKKNNNNDEEEDEDDEDEDKNDERRRILIV